MTNFSRGEAPFEIKFKIVLQTCKCFHEFIQKFTGLKFAFVVRLLAQLCHLLTDHRQDYFLGENRSKVLSLENLTKHWIINLLAFSQNNICCSHEFIVRVYLDVFNGEHNRIIFIILVFDYLSFILVFNLIDSLIDLKLDRP